MAAPVIELPEENETAEAELISFGLGLENEPTVTETVEMPKAEEIKFEDPTPTISDDQKAAFDNLVFDFPQKEEPVAEAPKEPEFVEPEFEVPTFEPEPVPVIKETPVSLGLEPKPSDAVSLEDLENDLFGELPEDAEPETTKKIDKFYTLYRKNEEFQRLLDEEYNRLKVAGANESVQEEPVTAASAASSLEDFAKNDVTETVQKTEENITPSVSAEAEATNAVLEELTENSRPVEDATIYKVGMPEEVTEAAEKLESNENANAGFSVGGEASKEESKFGLDGSEAAAAAAAVAGTAVAAGAAADKKSKKAAKKAEKEAKKAAKKAKNVVEDPQVEYENVDAGSTVLTILAVLIAILLVVLLAIILILHIAPNSGPAMKIDVIIENITGSLSAVKAVGGIKWL